MWIHVPSTSSACSAELADSITASDWRFLALERSASWSTTPSPAKLWFARWKRLAWLRRLCGRISEPSTAARGAKSWISSLAASRAPTSASPASGKESPASTRDSGASSAASSRKPSRSPSSSRTPPGSALRPGTFATWTGRAWITTQTDLFARSEQFSAIWPRWGSMRNGACCERPTLAPLTNGRGYLFWLTPDADAGTGFNQSPSRGAAVRPVLGAAVRDWPTARSTDGSKGGPNQAGRKGDLMLPSAASQWTTPKASDTDRGDCPSERNRRTPFLPSQVIQWPTPQAHDQATPKTPEQIAEMKARNPHRPPGVKNLNELATQWPTPNAGDEKAGASNLPHRRQVSLPRTTAQWATPTTQDAKNSTAPPLAVESQQRQPSGPGREVPFPPGPADSEGWAAYLALYPGLEPAIDVNGRRVLNPAFDEALMGWPIGMTTVCDCAGPCACDRLDRLRLCGNGVVPLQAAHAFEQLARRMVTP